MLTALKRHRTSQVAAQIHAEDSPEIAALVPDFFDGHLATKKWITSNDHCGAIMHFIKHHHLAYNKDHHGALWASLWS